MNKTSDQWEKDLEPWFPATHIIWEIVSDLKAAEIALKNSVRPTPQPTYNTYDEYD